VYRFPHRLHKASTECANPYKCFAEDYQTEHRRRAFSTRRVVEKWTIIPPFTMMPCNVCQLFIAACCAMFVITRRRDSTHEHFMYQTGNPSNINSSLRMNASFSHFAKIEESCREMDYKPPPPPPPLDFGKV